MQILDAAHCSCQEPSTQRAVCHNADAQLPAGRDNVNLHAVFGCIHLKSSSGLSYHDVSTFMNLFCSFYLVIIIATDAWSTSCFLVHGWFYIPLKDRSSHFSSYLAVSMLYTCVRKVGRQTMLCLCLDLTGCSCADKLPACSSVRTYHSRADGSLPDWSMLTSLSCVSHDSLMRYMLPVHCLKDKGGGCRGRQGPGTVICRQGISSIL